MINRPRTVVRKCSLEGLYVCAGRLDILNILKSPLICTVSYLNLGALGLCLEGRSHQSILVATGLNPPELPISDEARNDAHNVSTGVKLH